MLGELVYIQDTMSFPPHRPPMTMPGLPPVPPMLPPPYSMPPMGGMIPMPMGMMPTVYEMMAPVAVSMPPSIPIMAPQRPPMKRTPVPPTTSSSSTVNQKKEMMQAQHYRSSKSQPYVETSSNESKGPPVTVFVGNITDKASDGLIRLVLQKCGSVVSWKRVQGANGWLQAFGFCEYADPESAMRAIRILHEWEIADKKLVVKVDAKAKERLEEYKANKKSQHSSSNSEPVVEKASENPDEVDEETKKQDADVRRAIENLLQTHQGELNRVVETPVPAPTPHLPPPLQTKSSKADTPEPEREIRPANKGDLDDMDIEEDKKNLITREIDKFRDTYKRAEEDKDKDRDKDRRRERERKERKERTPDRRERNRERERQSRESRERSRDRERERERDRDRSHDRVSRSRSRSIDREWPARERERERSRERSLTFLTRSREKERDWDRDKEEEEEAHERKKLERKLREKEAAYQERLRNWEMRERRKAKEYEKERQKEDEKRLEELKEARRLKEFLEDYDDERDDPKFYKGSALQRRLREREKEIEADNKDRQREREELDELKRKLADEGHPDPDAEAKRIHREEEARLMKSRIKHEPPEPEPEVEPEAKFKPHKMVPVPLKEETPPSVEVESSRSRTIKKIVEDDSTQNSLSGFSDVVTPKEEIKPLGFAGLKLESERMVPRKGPFSEKAQSLYRSKRTTLNSRGSPPSKSPTVSNSGHSKRKGKIAVSDVFNSNDDDIGEGKKKRKLIPLDDPQEDSKSSSHMSTEEKRKCIKDLIAKIPTSKEELFAFSIDRSLVDNSLMERRIRPWINKKIVEYIGEEEPTLVDFICSKVLAGSAAQSILNDVSMVLDEEAEGFVVKMWRLLIYEIEAKKLGLVNSSYADGNV